MVCETHEQEQTVKRQFMTSAIAALTALLCGCAASEVTSENCPDVGYSAINLAIEDSITGARFPFTDVYALAIDGTFRDSTHVATIDGVPGPVAVGLAFGRAGTYSVEVKAAGYSVWKKNDIVAAEGACRKVVPSAVAVRLRKE